jgi:hypothetical protein
VIDRKDISTLLQRQLEQHGYHLTSDEIADVSAQLLMAIDEHPIAQLLSARLAMIEAGITGSSLWFYGDRTPEAKAVICQWAADHNDTVKFEQRSSGIVTVEHRKTFDTIVSWYSTFEDASSGRLAGTVQP